MSQNPGSHDARTPDNASSANVSKSLQRFRAMNIANSSSPTPNIRAASLTPSGVSNPRPWVLSVDSGKLSTPQLLPHNVLRDKLLESRVQSTSTQQDPAKPTTAELSADWDQDSAGTWNSPREISTPSSAEMQGAPLPAPLHIIEAAGSSRLTQHKQSASTVSLAVSDGLDLPDGQDHQQVDEEDPWGQAAEAAVDHADPKSQQAALAAIHQWETDKENYPVIKLTESRDPRIDDCDIDPATGQLVPPVRYIKIQRDTVDEHCHDRTDPNWRRLHKTSEYAISSEIARREGFKQQIERMVQEDQIVPQSLQEEEWPKAHCTLRPVESGDFQGIADIMNLEMRQGPYSQIFLPRVEPGHIATIYNACLQKRRPFIVAIPGVRELPNRAGWSKDDEDDYQEFLKFKKARGAAQPPSILGFAFVTDSRQGFLGGVCLGSRFSGLIKLAVHPGHRRKLVGSALLDRVLMSVAMYHRSLLDYTWDCPESRGIYEEISAHNTQQYVKVYIETLFNGDEDPRINGMKQLLDKFEFEQVACFKDAVKHGNQPGVWKDLVVWEHEARSTSEIVEG
ncbi:hypothetical protein NW762_002866 [Fusarium torreyae]|uniref:N-acetyltransferase domain-containing protein n=1 Tax=Fusarium torreyae TaxID=1237075 RepID=A0A9W8SC13_9HYPO|nr:hypothetical protein NW762_002866 [Fusarium torreyae]